MNQSPIQLCREEMLMAMAGSLHTISRPIVMPADINPEDLTACQIVQAEGSEEWVLVTGDGLPLAAVECPFGHGDAWLWVQEPFVRAADSDRIIYKSDLPEAAWEGVAWENSRAMNKNTSLFSLRIHDIKVAWVKDPEQGMQQCWSLGIHTYPCGINEIPVVNEAAEQVLLTA